ncbi:MAG: hypothetical protein CM1200mP24_00560 [Gammaproteobacteria bacterium]|nr:MAG: hypothetical protein CM1200mP24_00560 [Gammaproteobacteria bacterium]
MLANEHENQAKILVIDDDPELRELLEAYLSQQGFDVVTVRDGLEMDAIFAKFRIDLVILDLMLPGKMASRSLSD